ncbi:unnamed protein product [Prorocentrum cordatum]|uniref:Uncharacterized protein n=1 Tax=Prorocentrum cordatum TaxID=2364126 RepID=A0ABN9QRU9_9DINO|nr:unnamed protein product [Polarella glacialis]
MRGSQVAESRGAETGTMLGSRWCSGSRAFPWIQVPVRRPAPWRGAAGGTGGGGALWAPRSLCAGGAAEGKKGGLSEACARLWRDGTSLEGRFAGASGEKRLDRAEGDCDGGLTLNGDVKFASALGLSLGLRGLSLTREGCQRDRPGGTPGPVQGAPEAAGVFVAKEDHGPWGDAVAKEDQGRVEVTIFGQLSEEVVGVGCLQPSVGARIPQALPVREVDAWRGAGGGASCWVGRVPARLNQRRPSSENMAVRRSKWASMASRRASLICPTSFQGFLADFVHASPLEVSRAVWLPANLWTGLSEVDTARNPKLTRARASMEWAGFEQAPPAAAWAARAPSGPEHSCRAPCLRPAARARRELGPPAVGDHGLVELVERLKTLADGPPALSSLNCRAKVWRAAWRVEVEGVAWRAGAFKKIAAEAEGCTAIKADGELAKNDPADARGTSARVALNARVDGMRRIACDPEHGVGIVGAVHHLHGACSGAMASAGSRAGRRAAPLLAGAALLGGGVALGARELSRELPAPCRVVALHLQDPAVRNQLGFSAAPWSLRLWHGQVDEVFARLTVPLFEVQAPLPELLPWLRVPRRRSELHAALERTPSGERLRWLLEVSPPPLPQCLGLLLFFAGARGAAGPGTDTRAVFAQFRFARRGSEFILTPCSCSPIRRTFRFDPMSRLGSFVPWPRSAAMLPGP